MKRFSKIHALAAAIAVLAAVAASLSARPITVSTQDSPDKKEIREYQLTTDKLTRFGSASKAVEKLLNDNPNLEQQLSAASQNNAGPNTIAQSAAAMDKFPQLTAAIKPFGFSSHEYIVMTFALMNSYGYVETKKSSPDAPLPLTVSAANAAFVAANEARIQALLQSLQQ
jgi:hypothetical protein